MSDNTSTTTRRKQPITAAEARARAFNQFAGVVAILGQSRATVARIISNPKSKFPRPVSVPGITRRTWRTADVVRWIDQLTAAR